MLGEPSNFFPANFVLKSDDEDVEKDISLPGQLSVHLVEKIWILVNFIKREDSFDIRPGHFYW